MGRLRRHLTYANVLATITAFAVLAGGTALAANQLAKGSVGKKQLKASAVTTAKLKKNAVSKAKIAAGAIDGSRVKAAGLAAADFQLPNVPYTHIAGELRSTSTVQIPSSELFNYPLPGATFVQVAGRSDTYVGAVDFTFQPSCVDRHAIVYLLIDPPTPIKIDPSIITYIAAAGSFEEKGNAAITKRVNLVPFTNTWRPGLPTPQTHTFTALMSAGCESGSGVSSNFFGVDVIGTK